MSFKRQRGITLVEIMIASTVGLLLMAGVIQVFISSKQAYRMQETNSRLQENGRFAMEFLTRDIRMADFWGCAALSDVNNNLNPDPANGYIDISEGGLSGTEGGTGPDTLVLRGGAGTSVPVEKQPSGSAANIQVDEDDAKKANLNEGDILLVTNCENADIFQVNAGNPQSSGTLPHSTGQGRSGDTPGNATKALADNYTDEGDIMKMQEITYDISDNTLRRNGQPLIDDVEDMQVLYGEDTDGDGTANYYVSADQVADMKQVISVRVSLLLRTDEDNIATDEQTYTYNGATTTAADRRLRRVFTSTVQIRNRAI
jgi:type IV pilus assembly protein PilW